MSEEVKVIENEGETQAEERVIVFEEAIEAILFAAGHPVSYQTLARVLNMSPSEVKDKVFEYSLKYNDSELPRGVSFLTFKDSCQLCTKPTYLPEIRDALGIKRSGTLSSASLEVLAIVAYNQPVTRVFVDTLRRVDSSYAMNNLIDRGLIHSTGRLDVPGRPMLYGTTSDFLRCFGLSSLEDLPSTTDELIQAFEGVKTSTDGNGEQIEDGVQIEADIDSALPVNNIDTANDGNNDTAEQTATAPAEVVEIEEPSFEDDINID